MARAAVSTPTAETGGTHDPRPPQPAAQPVCGRCCPHVWVARFRAIAAGGRRALVPVGRGRSGGRPWIPRRPHAARLFARAGDAATDRTGVTGGHYLGEPVLCTGRVYLRRHRAAARPGAFTTRDAGCLPLVVCVRA